MTNEKRYELCCEALKAAELATDMPEGYLMNMAKLRIYGFNSFVDAIGPIMCEALEAMDKAKTSGAVLTAMKRIVKQAGRDCIKGVWSDADGKTCVCSGFHGAKLNIPIPSSLPVVSGFKGLADALKVPTDAERVQLPTVAEVKAFKAEHGKKSYMPICNGSKHVRCDFLLDMLGIFGNSCTVFSDLNPASPIFFQSEIGEGVLLPINPDYLKKVNAA